MCSLAQHSSGTLQLSTLSPIHLPVSSLDHIHVHHGASNVIVYVQFIYMYICIVKPVVLLARTSLTKSSVSLKIGGRGALHGGFPVPLFNYGPSHVEVFKRGKLV